MEQVALGRKHEPATMIKTRTIYIKGLELRVWLAQLGLARVLFRFSGDLVGEIGGVTCNVCFVSFQCQWHSVVLGGHGVSGAVL